MKRRLMNVICALLLLFMILSAICALVVIAWAAFTLSGWFWLGIFYLVFYLIGWITMVDRLIDRLSVWAETL